jgi:hypothetical protein
MRKISKKTIVIIGVIGSIASIIALLLFFKDKPTNQINFGNNNKENNAIIGNNNNIFKGPTTIYQTKTLKKEFSSWLSWFTLEKLNLTTSKKLYIYDRGTQQTDFTCYSVDRNTKIELSIEFTLNIDNSSQGIIYPIGLTDTWNKKIIEINNGYDIAEEKGKWGFQKKYQFKKSFITPNNTGKHFIIILSGAMLSVDHLFYLNSEKKSNLNDIWHTSFDELEGNKESIRKTYLHPNGREEEAMFPIIAICLNVN